MKKTVIALYDDLTSAERALNQLIRDGYDRNDISLVTNDKNGAYAAELEKGNYAKEGAAGGAGTGAAIGGVAGLLAGLGALAIPGIGPIVAAGPLVAALGGAAIGAASGGMVGGLVGMGIPEEEAKYYAEGIRRGGALLVVQVAELHVPQVLRIMNRYNPVDIERRVGEWRASGWTDFDESAYTTTTTAVNAEVGTQIDGQMTVPIVEEQLLVGKRTVEQDRVRVRSHVKQIPVEETVTLREEHLTVERRPVNRVVTDRDTIFNEFEEGTIKVTAQVEQAVVTKEARVVEEVVIRKDVGQRTEHITDTVRRTDVQVEQVGASGAVLTPEFEYYNTDFHTHFNSNYSRYGTTYDYYEPAYRYGYGLGTSDHYGNRTWAEVEPEARRRWEERNPGSWDKFKNSVRHAWEKVTN